MITSGEGGEYRIFAAAFLNVARFSIQVLGFKDTYIWLKDDNSGQKKRGGLWSTKALNSSAKVIVFAYTFNVPRKEKLRARYRNDCKRICFQERFRTFAILFVLYVKDPIRTRANPTINARARRDRGDFCVSQHDLPLIDASEAVVDDLGLYGPGSTFSFNISLAIVSWVTRQTETNEVTGFLVACREDRRGSSGYGF